MRWRVATAVVALALCALPKAALADGGGIGRLVTVKLVAAVPAETTAGPANGQPISYRVDSADADPAVEVTDDGDRIGDDSDVASVEGSANDDDRLDGGSF
jgi:hypothetical protein